MRSLAAIAFSFAAAILALCLLPAGSWAFWSAGVLAAAGAAVLLLPKLRSRRRLRAYLALIALSLAAGLLYGRCWSALVAQPVQEECGSSHLFSATVCDWPEQRDSGWRVTVRLADARGARAACYLSGEEAGLLEPGQALLGTAYWQDASVIGGEELSTFTSRGIFALLYCREMPTVSQGQAGSLRYLPQRMEKAFREMISRVWESDSTVSALLQAELLGDRSGISDDLSTRFSEAGVSHLFAVSGLHCAFLLTLLSLLIGHRRRLLAAVGTGVLIFYMFMVGLTPSVVRACIMQFFLLLAPLLLRDADPITSLAAALGLILLVNPYAAASVSLQLSFGAMLGLILVTPRVYGFFRAKCPKAKLAARAYIFLTGTLSSTLGAMVFTVPLTAYYFGVFSTAAPLTSLVCIPLASGNFMAGFLAVLLGFAWLPAARILGYVSWALSRLFLLAVDLAVSLPYHALYTDTNPFLVWWLVFVYVLFLLCILTRDRKRKYAVAAVLSVLALVLCINLRTAEYHSGDLTAVAVDVGQGASTLLLSGDDAVLVDCGSSNRYKHPAQQVLSQLSSMEVQRLTAVAVTHYHADHTNGLAELFSRVEIDRLYLPQMEDEYGVRDKLTALAREHGTQVLFVTEMQSIPLGESSLTVFPPVGSGDPNEQGLTYLCSSGDFDLLITGDMSGQTELELIRQYTLPDVEILMVGHHGSRYSSQPEFLSAISPEAAIISVGDNSYGHPTDAAISRLKAVGAEVYRTDDDGCVTVTVHYH